MIDAQRVRKEAAPYALAFAGSVALHAGLSPVSCPYVLGTDEWKGWYAGWALALDERMWADQMGVHLL
jgi:hypothetical protein